jgi:O-antigen ligase
MLLFAPTVLMLCAIGTKVQRAFAFTTVVFLLNSIVYTYQRAGLVSLAGQLLAILVLWPSKVKLKLLPLGLAAMGLFVFRLTPDNYWDRISTIQTFNEEASASSRIEINQASIAMLRDYPMGVGYHNYPVVSPRYLDAELLTEGKRSAHNSFFSVACETGLIGFAFWVSTWLGAIWLLRRIRRDVRAAELSQVELYALSLEVGLYGWLLFGLTHSVHEVDVAYWFVGLAVVLTRLKYGSRHANDHVRDPRERAAQ